MGTTVFAGSEEYEEDSQYSRFICVEDLMELLSIKTDKAYDLVHMHHFPSRKIGGIWRVDRQQVIDDFHTAPSEVKDLTEIWK